MRTPRLLVALSAVIIVLSGCGSSGSGSSGSGTLVGKFVYTGNFDGTVTSFSINPTTGALTPTSVSVTTVASGAGAYVGDVAADPVSRFLYVSAGNNATWGATSYRVDSSTGNLTSVQSLTTAPAGGATLAVAPSGAFLYDTDGVSSVLPIAVNPATGTLVSGTAVTIEANPGRGALDFTGRFLVFVAASTGTNKLSPLAVNPATGAVTTQTAVVAGNNPFALAFHPSNQFLYVANHNSNNVQVFSFNQTTGALASVSTTAGVSGAVGVAVHPSGRFLWAASDGGSAVHSFSVDPATGFLTRIQIAGAGLNPQGLAIDAQGKFAYTPNYTSQDVSVFSIDQTTGLLTTVTALPLTAVPATVVVANGPP